MKKDKDGFPIEQYDKLWVRLSKCCAAWVTFSIGDNIPHCKKCFNEVEIDTINPPNISHFLSLTKGESI